MHAAFQRPCETDMQDFKVGKLETSPAAARLLKSALLVWCGIIVGISETQRASSAAGPGDRISVATSSNRVTEKNTDNDA